MPTASFSQIKDLQARVGKAFDLKACKEALNACGCDLDAAEQALKAAAPAPAAAAPST